MSEPNWYVPDRRIMSKTAALEATRIAEWISIRCGLEQEPDEQAVFLALHACAYKAARRGARRQTGSAPEESTWSTRWQAIRSYIVEKNLGLVYSMIGRLGALALDQDERLSEAMYALTRAVDRFNPCRGYRFSTYACNVIARAIMRSAKRHNRYRRLFPMQHDTALERPEARSDSQTGLYVERLRRILDQRTGLLSEMESDILAQRFPAKSEDRRTFQQIGRTIGLSKERVRQIQSIALSKLREALVGDPVLA